MESTSFLSSNVLTASLNDKPIRTAYPIAGYTYAILYNETYNNQDCFRVKRVCK